MDQAKTRWTAVVAAPAMVVGFVVWEGTAPGGPAFPVPTVVTDSSPAADELQDKSCTAPGECVNACAFW